MADELNIFNGQFEQFDRLYIDVGELCKKKNGLILFDKSPVATRCLSRKRSEKEHTHTPAICLFLFFCVRFDFQSRKK